MAAELLAEIVETIPSVDIGRWVVRLGRINFAMAKNASVSRGGGMADSYIISSIARRARDDPAWRSHPDFEKAVVYQMKATIDAAKLLDFMRPTPDDPVRSPIKKNRLDVGRTALSVGYDRVDLLQPSQAVPGEQIIAVEAMAAACFMRHDAAHRIDWLLYEPHRQEEIREVIEAVQPEATYRVYTYPPSINGRILEDAEPITESLYMALSVDDPRINLTEIGLQFDGPLPPFWQELNRDLELIDQLASGSS